MNKTQIDRAQRQALKYRRMLEERRGGNFDYWSDKFDDMIENKGWNLASITTTRGEQLSIYSSEIAKEKVNQLRAAGNFARVVCGYERNVQRRKTYSVIYKPRAKKA